MDTIDMHRKIGIIGGLSPESTASYYLHITRSYVERCGDHSYPEIIIYSVSMEQYHTWRDADRWDLIARDLTGAAKKLQKAGADFGLLATNTMHKVFDAVAGAADLPLLHIIDATAAKARALGCHKLGLLGTRHTMNDGFYHARCAQHGLEMIVPEPDDQAIVHRIIIDELIRGSLTEASRREYLRVIHRLAEHGAEGIILGCTEIPLLVKQTDCAVPLLDTAVIHADAALAYAMRQPTGDD